MYAGVKKQSARGMGGMGFDWDIFGKLVDAGTKAVTSIVGGGPVVQPYPSTYPGTVYKQPQAGMDFTTIALLGLGIFFIVKMVK